MTATRGPGRPKVYRTSDGKRVPGATTIISRWKESGGLLHWAWNEGMEGRDYRDSRDKAADAGTLAHDLIDIEIHGDQRDPTGDYDNETVARAEKCVEAFREWAEMSHLEILQTEVPLVSDTHKFGGTLDAVARVNGKLCMVDWKTSNRVYHDYIMQVAAYTVLWENSGTCDSRYRIYGAHLLRFDKEWASFTHHYWPRPVIDVAADQFLRLREAYGVDKRLVKMV